MEQNAEIIFFISILIIKCFSKIAFVLRFISYCGWADLFQYCTGTFYGSDFAYKKKILLLPVNLRE